MKFNSVVMCGVSLLVLFLGGLGCSKDKDLGSCQVPQDLRTCVVEYSEALADCYQQENCDNQQDKLQNILSQLDDAVLGTCSDEHFAQLSAQAFSERVQNACESHASSLAWRVYGGPQNAVWSEASSSEQDCLVAAHDVGIDALEDSLEVLNECLEDNNCGAGVNAQRAEIEHDVQSSIEQSCDALNELVAVTPEIFAHRISHQADCLTATAHEDSSGADLKCGPDYAQFEAKRGEWTQVVVDGEEWGTLCGDGSDFAFQVRLAPQGAPLDRVFVGLQGGGVCVFESDCSSKMASNPGLFNAQDDEVFAVGISSNDLEESPFADWTQVYVPYCTQDVFAGGGVIEELGELELPRYGAVNMRAAVQMVRDVIWKEMDEQGGQGFRPDQLVAIFGGWSAGAYGTLYNYHWFLDDLQWPRTMAFPDAGLALDNGEALGVSGLGMLKIPAWGALPNLPPYCFSGSCAVGPTLLEAISPRLKQVPEQQFLIVTNPKDSIQQGDAYFGDEAFWINSIRQSYCDTRDLKGVNYYMTSVSDQSLHCVTIRPQLWSGAVDGETMKDWFWRAVDDPDSIESRVEEANFVNDIEGVEPYPCDVAP
ncbi:MAG: hypothetical protein CMK59_09375 [Proteobacteria bacterium]|nr:hypothetical protein [Pseudomonadota bacterium]